MLPLVTEDALIKSCFSNDRKVRWADWTVAHCEGLMTMMTMTPEVSSIVRGGGWALKTASK